MMWWRAEATSIKSLKKSTLRVFAQIWGIRGADDDDEVVPATGLVLSTDNVVAVFYPDRVRPGDWWRGVSTVSEGLKNNA